MPCFSKLEIHDTFALKTYNKITDTDDDLSESDTDDDTIEGNNEYKC